MRQCIPDSCLSEKKLPPCPRPLERSRQQRGRLEFFPSRIILTFASLCVQCASFNNTTSAPMTCNWQRRVGRLHFCRQSIHALLHLAPEVTRIGPPICSSQWTME